ncbi:hypothetical protein LSAT2_001276 [Lamellibrachia satsuma]|nr:hypothetical protein LSAT2_001276 [Lamellibrachia satsuma]
MGVGASIQLTSTHCGQPSTGGALESHDIMPLFRRQSEKARKKLQHQMYLAEESPDKTFDISDCELTKVPSGVYALCKVLQKEALLMHTNNLGSLQHGGDMQDLSALRSIGPKKPQRQAWKNMATNNMATAMESSSSESSFSDDEDVSHSDLPTILDSRDDRPYMFMPPVRENANRPEILPDSPP